MNTDLGPRPSHFKQTMASSFHLLIERSLFSGMCVWMNPFSAMHGHRLTLPYARTCEAYILDLLCNGKKSYGTGFWDFCIPNFKDHRGKGFGGRAPSDWLNLL